MPTVSRTETRSSYTSGSSTSAASRRSKRGFEGQGRPCGAGVDIGAYESGDCPPSAERFLRGEVDGDGKLQINDPIRLLNYPFLSGDEPTCLDGADAYDSGRLDITDAIYNLNFQFLGGPAPKSPFPDCGIDPLVDDLDCRRHPGCP